MNIDSLPEEFPGMCLIERLSKELPVLWDIRGPEGETREVPCTQVGFGACRYTCTVIFGKRNSIEGILDDSGSANCL